MKSNLRLVTALSAALAVGSAQAAPSFVPVLHGGQTIQVHGYRGWGHHRGWGWGPWAWLGLGAGIVAGAIIADEAYRPHPGHYYDEGPYDGPYYYPSNYGGDPREICAENFRSFEWETGFYTTYSGERRLCPYLADALPPPAAPPREAPYYGAAPPPYRDAGPPPPGAARYRDPGLPPPGPARPPYAEAVPPPGAPPYRNEGPPPGERYGYDGAPAQGDGPYRDAGPPQAEAPYGEAEEGAPSDDAGPPPRDEAPY
jgi:hypothetical protein